MKCLVCWQELRGGEAVIKFEGLEMETPVSVKSGVCFSGGVVHVECISELEPFVLEALGEARAVKHAFVDGKALCAR